MEMAVEMAEILAGDYIKNQEYEKAEEEQRQISVLRELLLHLKA